ncbi:hypothetical protein [Bradyrhizobium sp. 179]|uniref:hypothetical protein n=1 Tax=Bradyrhizobium sp. 179 TaxID=2782648 RepID=UPI003209C315
MHDVEQDLGDLEGLPGVLRLADALLDLLRDQLRVSIDERVLVVAVGDDEIGELLLAGPGADQRDEDAAEAVLRRLGPLDRGLGDLLDENVVELVDVVGGALEALGHLPLDIRIFDDVVDLAHELASLLRRHLGAASAIGGRTALLALGHGGPVRIEDVADLVVDEALNCEAQAIVGVVRQMRDIDPDRLQRLLVGRNKGLRAHLGHCDAARSDHRNELLNNLAELLDFVHAVLCPVSQK